MITDEINDQINNLSKSDFNVSSLAFSTTAENLPENRGLSGGKKNLISNCHFELKPVLS